MDKYVNLDALGIGKCNPDVFVNKGYAQGWNSAIEILENAPSADVRPVVRGRWIEEFDGFIRSYTCSECGEYALTKEETMHDEVCSNFCPSCGAQMDADMRGDG